MRSSRPPTSDAPPSDPGAPEPTPWKLWRRGGELSLSEGSHSIGRGLDCPILIESLGASRLHAKLYASADTLTIEDAGSTNGTYVNGQRVKRSRDLEHGDRILIGNTEFVVIHSLKVVRDSLTPAMSLAPTSSEPPKKPMSRPGQATRQIAATQEPPVLQPPTRPVPEPSLSSKPPALSKPADLPGDAPDADPELDTQQVDAIATLGRLADRMLVMGRIDAAERILGGHLRSLRESVGRGEKLQPKALQNATAYALKLAGASRSGAWIDIVIGIHLAHRKMLEPEVVRQVAQNVTSGIVLDRMLFEEYCAVVNDLMNEGDEFDRMIGSMILAIN